MATAAGEAGEAGTVAAAGGGPAEVPAVAVGTGDGVLDLISARSVALTMPLQHAQVDLQGSNGSRHRTWGHATPGTSQACMLVP